MAEKIMLFLSPLISKPQMLDEQYEMPDGNGTVWGYHTNEAPVKALLTLHPGVTDIICICSEEAERTAYSYFEAKILRFLGGRPVNILPIPFDTNQSVERELLPLVLGGGGLEPGDILYLDVTGGPRDNVIKTVLLSRALMYMGVRTRSMVYSSRIPSNQVIDITETLRVFDLLDGVQSFTSFGAVRQLRDFYGKRADNDAVEQLLVSMETLMDDVTLCRFTNLNAHLQAFNQAMQRDQFANEPLLEKLLPRFRETYCKGPNNEMSELELVAWCMDSDRLQTALTLYTENLPQLLMNHGLVQISRQNPEKEQRILEKKLKESEQNEAKLLINEYVLYMNLDWDKMKWKISNAPPELLVIENLPELLQSDQNRAADQQPFVALNCAAEDFQAVLRDFVYLRIIRNMLCHASTALQLKKIRLSNYFTHCPYARGKAYPSLTDGPSGLRSERLRSEQVKDVLRCAIARVEALIQQSKEQ